MRARQAMAAWSGTARRAWQQGLRLHREGVPLVATVHDELIAEVPEHEADATYAAMQKVMRASPAWAVDLPMDAAGFIASRYRKA